MKDVYQACSLRKPEYRRIWLVGAGHFGRELYGLLPDVQQHQETSLPVAGFLDDVWAPKPEGVFAALGEPARNMRIIPISDYAPQVGDVVINALGQASNKEALLPALVQRGANFAAFVHPTARMGCNNRFGLGCHIGPYCVCTTNISAGDFITIYSFSLIADDVTIDSFSTLMTRSFVGSGASLGYAVSLKSGAMVMEYASIGDRAVVGVNSVILRRAKAHTVYFGSPAVSIGKV